MNKIAIITGANTGLGLETTKAFAENNIEVVMACRNESKAEKAKAEILNEVPEAQLKILKLDLSSLDAVRNFVEKFNSEYDRLDILVNNAGLMIPPYGKTKDGFELQFGINYLGHFLLTGLLLEPLKNAAEARVVSLSSLAHKWGDIYFEDLQFQNNYDKQKAYGQSKLACLMFAYELDRRLKAQQLSVKSLAAHPGLSRTNLFRHLTEMMKLLTPFVYPFTQSAKSGAQPQIKAALDEKLAGGEYLGPSGFQEYSGKPKVVGSNAISKNKEKAKRLWEISEKLCNFQYL